MARRGSAALIGAADFATLELVRRRLRAEKQEDEFRAFQQKLSLLERQEALRAGRTQRIFVRDPQTGQLAEVGQVPAGSRVLTQGLGLDKPASEQEARRLFLGTRAGQPFPLVATPRTQLVSSPILSDPNRRVERPLGMGGGLPTTAGGRQLLQDLISEGATESPAAEIIRRPISFQTPQPPTRPQGAFLPQLLTSGIRGLLARRPPPPFSDLPPPEQFQEGSLIQDDQTGQRYRLIRGQWVPE